MSTSPEPNLDAQGSTLRARHPGHYWPTEQEFAQLWEHALIVLDAGVLLDLHRYSEATREALLGILESIRDRVWVPHQAAAEYQRNRIKVVRTHVAQYDEVLREIKKATGSLRTVAGELRRHPVLEKDRIIEMLESFSAEITDYVNEKRLEHPTDVSNPDALMLDPTREALDRILEGRIGPAYEAARLTALFDEGRRRFADEVPPGYLDARQKDEPERYGDFIFWKQAMDRAVQEGRPLLIITDDDKDDWWWRDAGLTLAPRHELVEEYHELTGRRFYMYLTPRFMERAREYLERPVSDEAISEVQRISRDHGPATVECPTCGDQVTFLLGGTQGSSAIPKCDACGTRFHAHRGSDGKAFTSRAVVQSFACPRCDAMIRESRPADTSQRITLKKCFKCLGQLALDWASGDASLLGDATVREGIQTTAKMMMCTACDSEIMIKWRDADGQAFGDCAACDAIVRAAVP